MRLVSIKGKLPLLLVAAVLLSMTWLGYWIGYMTYRSHIKNLQEQLDRIVPTEIHTTAHESAPQKGQDDMSPLYKLRNFGGTKGDNVYVVGSHTKLNEPKNRVDEINSVRHAIGIHEGHASQISQHINSVRDQDLDAGFGRGNQNSLDSNKVKGLFEAINHEHEKIKSKDNQQTNPSRIQNPVSSHGSSPKQLLLKDSTSSYSKPRLNNNAIEVPNQLNDAARKEDLDPAAIIEFQALRKRLHAKVPAEPTTLKPRPMPSAHHANPFLDPFRNDVPVDTFGKHYALMHSGEATKVHGELHADLQAIPNTVPTEAYTFKSKELPRNPRFRPSVANGQLGTAIHSAEVYMNGVYNGYRNESHRAIIPSTVSFNITATEPASNFTRTYILNTGDGVYSEESVSEAYTLTQRIYAHRRYSRLLVVEVDLVRQTLRTPLKLLVKLNRWAASPDLTFLGYPSNMEEVSYKVGHINAPETDDSERTNVHIYYDHVPSELVPVRGAMRTKWVFLTAIGKSKDEALQAYKQGARLVKSNDELYAEHIRAWASVWAAGRVDVVGNLGLAQDIYGAFYYILSSMPLSEDPTAPFIGLSPSGLPFGDLQKDYQGHVFWDQETWMLPAILPLWPSLGRLLLTTRRRTMDAAKQNAQKNKHQGLQFPWESAMTGIEVCPEAVYSEREIHVTGDIAHAILRYVYATNDTSILREDQKFGSLLTGIAYFYASVVKWNDTRGFYEIRGVMPPDEYHKNVNNSAYTNAIAKIALEAPEIIFKRANKTLDSFTHIAKDMYIPYSIPKKYHPEFDGYVEGTKVKQADVILLGYPLNIEMDISARRNDLKKYEKVTDVSGPAMSWSMFVIGWLEVGDEARADTMFRRNLQYIKNEFKVWQETLFGPGATNFLTGQGGFLQSVIYGYGGLRFYHDRLDLNPYLPLDCTELHFTGLSYLGSNLNVFIQKDSILVNLVGRGKSAPGLVLYLYKTEQVHTLELNHAVRIPRQKATITVPTQGNPV